MCPLSYVFDVIECTDKIGAGWKRETLCSSKHLNFRLTKGAGKSRKEEREREGGRERERERERKRRERG